MACTEEAPQLEKNIWKVYQSQGLQVLGISLTLNVAEVKTWGDTLGLTYPLLIDQNYSVWGQYGMGYIPHNTVIDPSMTVRYTTYGYKQAKIIEIIEQYLPDKAMVNDDFSGTNQSRPVLAAAADGSFITVWVDQRNQKSDIYAQRFDSHGEKISTNFKVNDVSWDSTSTTPELVDIAMADDRSYIITWQNKSLQTIFAQRYDPTGNRIGNNFKISTGQDPDIAISPVGSYVIVFRYSYPVRGKRYTSLQDTVGQEFIVSQIMEYHRNPAVAMAADGSFIVTWEAEVSMGVIRIYAQRYDANASEIGKNFRVDDDPAHNWKYSPAIAIAPDRSFFIVWQDYRSNEYGILGQQFSKEGAKLNPNFKMNTVDATPPPKSPAVAVNSDGNYIVTWEDYRNGTADIYAQRFDKHFVADGVNYQVNQNQDSSDQAASDVAYLANKIIHVWQDNRRTGQDWDIFFRIETKANRTIYVPDDYATIQEAIDHAIDGDTILVAPGNYDLSAGIWNDRVNNLILLGSREEDGSNASIINAAVDPGTYVAIKFFGVSGCTIAGFEVKNAHSGISLENCKSCLITKNYIHDNDQASTWHGDGIEIFRSENIDVTFNIVDHNEFHGIELQYQVKNVNIINNTILQTYGNDGIVLYDYLENVTIKNNIIAYSSEEGIELVYLWQGSPVNFVNDYNCFWQNGAGPIRSPFTTGPHSVLADPLLVDMAGHNYYLRPGSPCLGAGESGDNIGALGITTTAVSNVVSELPTTFELNQNYPNPFNAETQLQYQLAEKSQVTLKIYNLLGQEIRILVNDEKIAGYYTTHWDGKDANGILVGSGIYLCQMKAGSFISTRKLTILK